MNPLLVSWLAALLRAGLLLIGWNVADSEADLEKLAGALVMLGAVGWSLYQKYRADRLIRGV